MDMGKKMCPKIAMVILNWNGWKDTIECLESIFQIDYPNYEVIVIDNGSEDCSLEKIREYVCGKIKIESKFLKNECSNKPIALIEYTKEESEEIVGKMINLSQIPSNRKIILIKNHLNFGFAEGNNIGIRYALRNLNPNYLLLLNNDTVVDKAFLKEMVNVIESDSKIGIAGPKIYYYDNPKLICSAGARINLYKGTFSHVGCNEIDHGQLENGYMTDYVSGCALLINISVIDRIGLLNPLYFAYFEETELCVKAKNQGFSVMYVPSAKIWHKVASSSGKSGKSIYYFTRNRFFFVKRNSDSKLQQSIFILHFFLVDLPLNTLSILFLKRNYILLKNYYRGMYEGIKFFATMS